jgi:small subunit ribosomal protein S16
MLMIRFQRIGRKNDPAFRIAVLEKTAGPKAGKYVELVGNYNPKTKDTNLDADRIKYWISNGAQVSGSLHNLLINKGVLEGKKVNVLPKKTAPVKEVVAEEVAAPAPAAEAAPAIEEAPVETAPEASAAEPEATPELPTEAEVEAEAEPAPEEAPAADAASPEEAPAEAAAE